LNQSKKKQISEDFLAEKRKEQFPKLPGNGAKGNSAETKDPFYSPLGKIDKTKNPFGSPSGKIEETKKPIDLPLGEVDETKNPLGSPLGKVDRSKNSVYPPSGKNIDNDNTKKQESYFPSSDTGNKDFEAKKNKISSLEKVLVDETKNRFDSKESVGEGSASAEGSATALDASEKTGSKNRESSFFKSASFTSVVSQKTEAVSLGENTDFDSSKKKNSSFFVSADF